MPSHSPLPLIKNASNYDKQTAIKDARGTYTYGDLHHCSGYVSGFLLQDNADLTEARIALMAAPGFAFVSCLLGIWKAGGIAVPLCLSHPLPELQYVLENSGASVLICDAPYYDLLKPLVGQLKIPLFLSSEAMALHPAKEAWIDPERLALLLYTSGSTGQPKGVVLSHYNITAQIQSLADAWEWSAKDHILHFLPLHHTHGLINKLCCALWAGATCEFLPAFDSDVVWEKLISGEVNLLMAVPTIYVRLIRAFEAYDLQKQVRISRSLGHIRLMVSGSAALPAGVLEQWEVITGHRLLERYGMTETGMILSNPLHGERKAGSVGLPLPGVRVRLTEEGEVEVQGPGVFKAYWQQPEAKRLAFVEDWFRTGDIAAVEAGYYKLLGRKSVDIIKSGGYKISALQVEEALLLNNAIEACAVVSIPDEEWGEKVVAALELKTGFTLSEEEFKGWAKKLLAPYKIPREILFLPQLPRNAMGKVLKNEVKRLFVEGGAATG